MTQSAHNGSDRMSLNGYTLVVGLGDTGLSCVRHLRGAGVAVAVADSRSAPPGLDTLSSAHPDVPLLLGAFDGDVFASADSLVLSPGVAADEPAVITAAGAGVPVCGDIELFARAVRAPVVAITGSNGKSTVTSLVNEMAQRAGVRVEMGGNIGTPALDLLQRAPAELYVLELSSFQLEVTRSLRPRAATVLNISADHLDRHGNLDDYAAIKAGVYAGDGTMVVNRDDPRVAAMAEPGRRVVSFGLDRPASGQYGLDNCQGGLWLMCGEEPLMPAAEVRCPGRHNLANALAALALAEAVGLARQPLLETLRLFPGLPHRCQWLGELDGSQWYDDSKGTNVGATQAALAGVPGDKVVLIAGGEGKGQDFTPLRNEVQARARAVVLIGRDAELIAEALDGTATVQRAGDMVEAVALARSLARHGDSVLLSPACASFDMFRNYQARGEAFAAAFRGLSS